jgi:hypothetical protein
VQPSLPAYGETGRPVLRRTCGLDYMSALVPQRTRAVTYFVTSHSKALDILSPPCLLRLLPAGANFRVGLHPWKATPCHGVPRFRTSASARGKWKARRCSKARSQGLRIKRAVSIRRLLRASSPPSHPDKTAATPGGGRNYRRTSSYLNLVL